MTIGAGGGSLAWTDEAGSLRNGPQSAGANPGPACYGNGNRQATNTDANVVLGRLGTSLAGGKIMLDPALAAAAVDEVAASFGLSREAAADAIIRVANANMSDAVRLISISRGYDPRDFALVAFGGAGALHGAAIAKDLSIPAVIVPPNPGVTSALGCLLVDVQHDFSESYFAAADEADPAAIEAEFGKLESRGARAPRPRGRSGRRHRAAAFDRHDVSGPVALAGCGGADARSAPSRDLTEAFHRSHEREYNFRRDDAPVGLFRLNLKAIGVVPKAQLAAHAPTGTTPQPKSRRPVWFDAEAGVDTPVYERADLPAGFSLRGPAVVEQVDSTVVIPPGATASVDQYLNIIIRVTE